MVLSDPGPAPTWFMVGFTLMGVVVMLWLMAGITFYVYIFTKALMRNPRAVWVIPVIVFYLIVLAAFVAVSI